jgi:hypothetical protein
MSNRRRSPTQRGQSRGRLLHLAIVQTEQNCFGSGFAAGPSSKRSVRLWERNARVEHGVKRKTKRQEEVSQCHAYLSPPPSLAAFIGNAAADALDPQVRSGGPNSKEGCSSAPSASKAPSASGDLSDQLAQSNGVICPPSGVDPKMATPPPRGGATPLFRRRAHPAAIRTPSRNSDAPPRGARWHSCYFWAALSLFGARLAGLRVRTLGLMLLVHFCGLRALA